MHVTVQLAFTPVMAEENRSAPSAGHRQAVYGWPDRKWVCLKVVAVPSDGQETNGDIIILLPSRIS